MPRASGKSVESSKCRLSLTTIEEAIYLLNGSGTTMGSKFELEIPTV